MMIYTDMYTPIHNYMYYMKGAYILLLIIWSNKRCRFAIHVILRPTPMFI